jgi:hypothetical protein
MHPCAGKARPPCNRCRAQASLPILHSRTKLTRFINLLTNGSWYQPAIDAITYSLMRQFNQLPSGAERLSKGNERDIQPLVYTTCQAYLRRCIPISNYLCADMIRFGWYSRITCFQDSRVSRLFNRRCKSKQLRSRSETCSRRISPTRNRRTRVGTW